MLELVAPAGEMDSFRLALANGADAIYAGGKSFSARQNAANFGPAELAGAIRLAHLHRVKVYLTMNTLVRRDEMDEALAQARAARESGVDALIVQDLGLLLELRRLLPDLRIHASTQMTVANAATLRILGDLGVSRVVVAREAGVDEIKRMAAAGPEIEVFVHGALCFCYSGQCLMSSIIGGRSGNRGRCAQPCRMEYTLLGPDGSEAAGEAGRYPLSPRDLRLLPHLPLLDAAGVRALKIEGRMKRPEYVATVVRIYRQALDRLAADPEHFAALPEEERDLEQIFNRSFTPGFFLGDQGLAFLSGLRPNNRGLAAGRVSAVDGRRDRVTVAASVELHQGDGIEIWVSQGGRLGTVLEEMEVGGQSVATAPAGREVEFRLRGPARPGDRVFRTNDARLMAGALAPLAAGTALPFSARVRVRPGEPVHLELCDDEGNRVEVRGELAGQEARNRPLDEGAIREQLSRTGGTPWRPERIEVDLAPGTMVPISEFNRIRRAALDALEEKRLAATVSPPPPAQTGGLPAAVNRAIRADGDLALSATVGTLPEAEAAMQAGIDRLYLAAWVQPWPDEELALLRTMAERRAVALIFALPRVVPEKEAAYWLAELDRAAAAGLDSARAGDPGLAMAAALRWPGRVDLDYSFNIFNPWTLRAVAGFGGRAALSPELTLAQARELATAAAARGEIIVHGRLEMMHIAHCALGSLCGGKKGPGDICGRPCRGGQYALRDRLGLIFPLVPDRFCRLHLYNSLDLSVLPELDKFAGSGCDLRLELAGRGPEYAAAVVGTYRQGLTDLRRGRWRAENGRLAQDKLAVYSPAGFTRGHFFRGVE